MKTGYVLLGWVVLAACQPASKNYNQEIEIIHQFDELDARFDAEPNQLWVVNFWATSCPPCVKEMPLFVRLDKEREEVKILLVSLDRVKDLDNRVYPFVQQHGITPEVVLLGDQNYSYWTEKIDPSWYGALPATVIFKGDRRTFRFGEYETYQELEEDVQGIMID
jgi:thiol-disulfide isomerase/thioredoxin